MVTIKPYAGCKLVSGSKKSHLPILYTTVTDQIKRIITIVKVTERYEQQGRSEREYMTGEDGKTIEYTLAQFVSESLEEICKHIADYTTHGYKIKGSDSHKKFIESTFKVYTKFGGVEVFKGSIQNGVYTKTNP